MKFEVGKEYRTRDGRKAGIYCDLSSAPDYVYVFPLKGYVEQGGVRADATWTTAGRYQGEKYKSEADLVLPVRECESYLFTVWRNNGDTSTLSRKTREKAEKVRNQWRNGGCRVSPVVTVVFTEDLGE